jgi:hypothetical protein
LLFVFVVWSVPRSTSSPDHVSAIIPELRALQTHEHGKHQVFKMTSQGISFTFKYIENESVVCPLQQTVKKYNLRQFRGSIKPI